MLGAAGVIQCSIRGDMAFAGAVAQHLGAGEHVVAVIGWRRKPLLVLTTGRLLSVAPRNLVSSGAVTAWDPALVATARMHDGHVEVVMRSGHRLVADLFGPQDAPRFLDGLDDLRHRQ